MLRSGERTHAERSGADAQSHVHGYWAIDLHVLVSTRTISKR